MNTTTQTAVVENYKVHRILIYSLVIVFNVFGLFGNLNIVVLTYRKKSLRSNFGLILCFLALLHSLCLLYEFVDMGFSIAVTFYEYDIHRHVCFYSLFPYIFLHCLQTGTIWVLSLDLLLAISFPVKYRKFSRDAYFTCLFTPALVYGVMAVAVGFAFPDDDDILMCNPPSSLTRISNHVFYTGMSIFSFLTIDFYAIAFILIYFKMRNHSKDINLIEKKALRTLKVLIFVFVVFRLVSTLTTTTLIAIGVDKSILQLVQNYNVIPNLLSYSQNGYVCYFRSSEYRALLREQFGILFPSVLRSNLPSSVGSEAKPITRNPSRPLGRRCSQVSCRSVVVV